MNKKISACVVAAAAFVVATAGAQQAAPDKVTVTLSDPARPALVKVSLMNGGITVRGHEGRDVVITTRQREDDERDSEVPARAQGMKRIGGSGPGIEVVESSNVVEIESNSFNRPVDLDIQVPRRTSLNLSTVNDGDVRVENVQGEIEVKDLNGEVTLTGIAGSAVVHALNGEIKVVFSEVSPDKPMSFSSMNGDIDVTFPAGFKANLVMQSQNGEVFTDFDVKMETRTSAPAVEDARSKGGKFKVKVDKAVYGTVNGGGAEVRFKNFNGDIYIRRAAAK